MGSPSGAAAREAKVACAAEALIAVLCELGLNASVGLEAGPLSQRLQRHLRDAGLEAVLTETRPVMGALESMRIKTDGRDALGIVQLIRIGWLRPVHRKSVSAPELSVLLGARRTLQKLIISIELSMRGLLRGVGLKLGQISCRPLRVRALELANGHEVLTAMVTSIVRSQIALRRRPEGLDGHCAGWRERTRCDGC